MRREFLKGYIFALIAEGRIRANDARGSIFTKMLDCAREDFPAVLTELGAEVIKQGTVHYSAVMSDAFLGYMNQIAQGLKTRGFGAVWKDIKETYKRGADEKARGNR